MIIEGIDDIWKYAQPKIKICGETSTTNTPDKYTKDNQGVWTFKSDKIALVPAGALYLEIRPHTYKNGVAPTFVIEDTTYVLTDIFHAEMKVDPSSCKILYVPEKKIESITGIYMIRVAYPPDSTVTKAQLDTLFL